MCMPGIIHETLGLVYHHYGLILGTLHKECNANRIYLEREAKYSISVNPATATTSS